MLRAALPASGSAAWGLRNWQVPSCGEGCLARSASRDRDLPGRVWGNLLTLTVGPDGIATSRRG
eukprot:11345924-Alexandrium_andersonii.AAC.1